ncbi:interferon alpha/beta receptor 2-like [Hoplias malabaricus]|uniref:interferon alpha/beta receptor 2-like n=1 Tax=Hoplias malabaricus TaxID=27720 RepID=UPI0034629E7B
MWSTMKLSSEQHRTLCFWIILFLPIYQGYCLLPAPQNVTIVSVNLEHELIWTAGPGTPTFARFRVQRYHNEKKLWVPVLNCSDLGDGEPCDLTTSFKSTDCCYWARVQAFLSEHESNWTTSKPFSPLWETILGPPVVELRGCGNCLLLQLHPPASRTHHRWLLDYYFQNYIINVSRTRDKAQFVIRASSGENLINYLEKGVEYCVVVIMEKHLNNRVVPSGPHCAYTSPEPINTVLVFLITLCTLCLLGMLFCAALLHRVQPGALHRLLQRVWYYRAYS